MICDGIIIRCTPYKEHDAMINLLTKKELLSFNARCVFKFEHKNNILSSPLLYGEFTFSDNKDKFLLFKEINPIFDSKTYFDNIKILSFINLINEILLKIVEENDLIYLYDDLVYILTNINKIELNITITYLVSKILNITGYGLDTTNYNLEKYISFDYINGRFISINEFNSNINRRYSKEEKELLYFSFNKTISFIQNLEYKTEDIKKVNSDLFNYINSVFNITLKSVKMVEKVL